jgi:radical SAM superfamily enzyme YgiQ (UPF0313 family)
MSNRLVYICDLTHTAQCVSSDFFPYGAACVGAYLQEKSVSRPKVEIFKLPHDLEQGFQREIPDLVAFSSYMWNTQLSLKIAHAIKQRHPQVPIVFGGTNFPEERERKKAWLQKYPWVDFFVAKEGEIPFQILVDEIFSRGLEAARSTILPNTSSIAGGRFYSGDVGRRIQSLDDVPSPYLLGLMDKFMDQLSWVVTETNRGCPFECTFCLEGDVYWNKVAKRENSRIVRELEYIAEHHRNAKMLFFADSNFIMFRENLEVCQALADSQRKYGWPRFIGCSTGKNKKDLVIEGTAILGGSISLSGAVQSLEPQVLKNIKRSNISVAQMMDVAAATRTSGTPAYTELIACLPGDTLESYKRSLQNCIESGIDIIKTHTLILLEGAELNSQDSRERYGLKTKLRPVSKSFGNYVFGGDTISCIETEELVCETSTLPFDDYLECRRLQLTTQYFYNDNLFEEIQNVFRFLGLSVWDWFIRVHEGAHHATGQQKAVYDLFMGEITEELWDSEDALQEFIKTHMDEFLGGRRGNNVTFKFRALLLKNYLPAFLDIGYRHAAELLAERQVDNLELWLDYLHEQQDVAMLRKGDVFDFSRSHVYDLKYRPVPGVRAKDVDVSAFPVTEPKQVQIAHSERQQKMLKEHSDLYGQDIIQLAALLNRVPARTFYREIAPIER